jgi:hypothetical protein
MTQGRLLPGTWLQAGRAVSHRTGLKLLAGLRTFQPRFRFPDHFLGVSILVRIITGFIPQLMAVVELGLCSGGVDLFRPARALSKNGYPLGEHFYKAARDAEALLPGFAAVQPHFARPKKGKQRGVSVKDLEVAGLRRHLHGIRRLIDEDAIGSDEPDLQMIRIRHSYLYAVAFIFSAASSTSSMVPFI